MFKKFAFLLFSRTIIFYQAAYILFQFDWHQSHISVERFRLTAMNPNLSCRIPALVLSVTALVANISVIVSIMRNKSTRSTCGFIIACICFSNTIFGFSQPISAAIGSSFQAVRQYTSIPIVFVQLGLHFPLAHDRWITVAKPQKYRQPHHRIVLKRTAVVLVITAIAIGIVIGSSPAIVYVAMYYITLSLRVLAIIVISILYIYMYKSVKVNNRRVAGHSNEANNDNPGTQLRRKNEKYLFFLCMWITASFLVFNIPISVFTALVKGNPPCNTTNGKLFGAVFFVFVINGLCDPITYFIIERRRRRARVVPTGQQC